MTARTFILTTGAFLAIVAPAANAATAKTVPAKAIIKVHRPAITAHVSTPLARAPVVGPSCDDVDATYTLCVGAAWSASQPTPVISAAISTAAATRLLSPLDDGTQDG